jgi:hypothetical protein
MPFKIECHGWELYVSDLACSIVPESGSAPMARTRCTSMECRSLSYPVTSAVHRPR